MAGAGQPDTCFDGTDEIFWHPIWVVLRMPKQSITSAEKENAMAKCVCSAVWAGRQLVTSFPFSRRVGCHTQQALCATGHVSSGSGQWGFSQGYQAGLQGVLAAADTFVGMLPAASITTAYLAGKEPRVRESDDMSVWSSRVWSWFFSLQVPAPSIKTHVLECPSLRRMIWSDVRLKRGGQ